jgi:DmX-like protein
MYLIFFQVCSQTLVLPPGVHVNSVNIAAGHLSSASIYPACFAPYLLATACSDGHVYFWRCDTSTIVPASIPIGNISAGPVKHVWKEWEMMIRKKDTSTIQVPGKTCSSVVDVAALSRSIIFVSPFTLLPS